MLYFKLYVFMLKLMAVLFATELFQGSWPAVFLLLLLLLSAFEGNETTNNRKKNKFFRT